MELKFEELEGSEVDNSNNINYSNYWSTNNQSIKTNEKNLQSSPITFNKCKRICTTKPEFRYNNLQGSI